MSITGEITAEPAEDQRPCYLRAFTDSVVRLLQVRANHMNASSHQPAAPATFSSAALSSELPDSALDGGAARRHILLQEIIPATEACVAKIQDQTPAT